MLMMMQKKDNIEGEFDRPESFAFQAISLIKRFQETELRQPSAEHPHVTYEYKRSQ